MAKGTRKDDTDAIPEPQAEATDSEKHRAASFGKLVDDVIAGEPLPPALEAEQRELADLAATLRASVRDVPLAEERRAQLIESAFAEAIGAGEPKRAKRDGGGGGGAPVTSLADRRSRMGRMAPWAAAIACAAAAILLLVFRPAPETRTVKHTEVVEQTEIGDQHLSRPSDALVGRIDSADADNASDRIDMIYADRMVGYRDLQLRGLTKSKGAPK